MGLLFKVRPKRCDSQCLVQTSQETRDSKERKKCKETRIIHSRDKLDQIIPHFKKLKRFKLFIGFPRDPGARVSEDQNPIQPQFTIFLIFFPEEHEFLIQPLRFQLLRRALTTTVPTYVFQNCVGQPNSVFRSYSGYKQVLEHFGYYRFSGKTSSDEAKISISKILLQQTTPQLWQTVGIFF